MKEIIINQNEDSSKIIALVENGRLIEKYDEKQEERVLEGNIYCGIVKDILPGMQSAFIDIGENKTSCKLWIQSFDIIALIAYDDNTVYVTILRDDDGLIEIESYDCAANRKNKYLYMPKNYYYYNMLYIIKKINEVYNYYHKIVV